ncbi:MAG: hypothetical protein ABFS32_10635 [Bacteroidota bacterium]
MNKKLFFILMLSLLSFQLSFGQISHEITLTYERLNLPDRQFYIDSIIDNRNDKSNIGLIYQRTSNTRLPLVFADGFNESLKKYINHLLPREGTQVPIILKINKLEVLEEKSKADEFGFVNLEVEYYFNQYQIYSDEQIAEVKNLEVTNLHESNIRQTLKESFTEFNSTNWYNRVLYGQIHNDYSPPANQASGNIETDTTDSSTPTNDSEITSEETIPDSSKPTEYLVQDEPIRKNIIAVGYQIGGYTLIGVDYEIRVHDYFGIHLGAGFAGFTGGIKIHTSADRNSPFFNLSYKDSGFGLFSAFAIEYGGRWVFNESRGQLGLHYQGGISKILYIDPELEDLLFNGEDAPPFLLSLGIGLSW